jgi:hypothetical protein
MKTRTRAWLLALVTWGAAGASWGQAETFRCQQANGTVSFQQTPCALADLVNSEPARPAAPPVVAAPAEPKPAAVPVVPPARRPAPERSVSTPAPAILPPHTARADPAQEDGFVKPTRRKREVLELTAQFERCRADVAGFAEQSAPVYAAWIRRYGPVMVEYRKLLNAKVRAARRGEMTLPVQQCTDEWLREIEPMSRSPDPRFQTVEQTWQVFMGALMTGDRTALLASLSGKAQARWKERAERLSDEEMRRIGASVRALKVQWGDDYEKEGMVADNENRGASIAFRNINDEWKISDLGGAPAVPLPALPASAASVAPAAPAAAASAPRAD